MTFEQEIDASRFSQALENLQDCVRRGLADPEIGTVPKQAQLLTEHCIRLTPPKTASQGRKRVSADVAKVFRQLNPADFTEKSVSDLIRRGDQAAWSAFSNNTRGRLAGTVAITPTEELHRKNRDRRGRAKKTVFVSLWPTRAAYRGVLNRALGAVGWARAGWLRAYTALGGTRVSDWFARHGQVRGIFIGGLFDPSPYVIVGNDTGWGKGGEAGRIVNDAMRSRRRAMETYARKMADLSSRGILTPWQQKKATIAAQFFNEAA